MNIAVIMYANSIAAKITEVYLNRIVEYSNPVINENSKIITANDVNF